MEEFNKETGTNNNILQKSLKKILHQCHSKIVEKFNDKFQKIY